MSRQSSPLYSPQSNFARSLLVGQLTPQAVARPRVRIYTPAFFQKLDRIEELITHLQSVQGNDYTKKPLYQQKKQELRKIKTKLQQFKKNAESRKQDINTTIIISQRGQFTGQYSRQEKDVIQSFVQDFQKIVDNLSVFFQSHPSQQKQSPQFRLRASARPFYPGAIQGGSS